MTGMKFWVLALASIASCMVALDALVVTTALSAIRVGLGASLESLEWTVNAYNLSFAVLLLTGTALGDRFGRRRMFSYGIGLFAARIGRLWAGEQRRLADRRTRAPGSRRSSGRTARDGVAGRGVSSRRARAGTRDLQ